MEGISATVNSMGQNSGLLSSLTDWNSTLAGYADSISTGVVMPVALTLLALFMILELYNATQRIAMNGSNNAFTIQQIALVMLKIVVCRWAVVHTTEILNALFEVASTVTVGISGYVGSGEVNTTVDIENAIAALPGGIGNMPVALELMVVGWMLRIVNIVVNTIVAARFIELYVYNAMASLSIATLCYQELHGIAVNFLKSYLGLTSYAPQTGTPPCQYRAQCCIWSSAFILHWPLRWEPAAASRNRHGQCWGSRLSCWWQCL